VSAEKLSDGITGSHYVIADVYTINGRRFNIIEIQWENGPYQC